MTGELIAETFTPTLFDSFIDWIDRTENTAKTYLNHLRQFFAWTKYRDIIKPIREDIVAFRDWLLSEHEAIQYDRETGWTYRRDKAGRILLLICTPSTAAQYLRSVKQFFRWTGAAGLYPDIAQNVRPPKIAHGVHKRDALTVEQVQTVEESIKENSLARIETAKTERKDTEGRTQRQTEQGARLLAMYELAVTAGLRVVELSRARVKDFEENDGQAFLWIHGKGHSEADTRKPLAPEVADAVKKYLHIRGGQLAGNEPLFTSTGNRSGGRRIAARTIGSMIKKALRAAGLNSRRITAHSLRHTAGTTLYEMTADLYAVQKYMRHEHPSTTETYIHADTERKEADFAARLYDIYHGKEADEEGKLAAIIARLPKNKLGELAKVAEAMT